MPTKSDAQLQQEIDRLERMLSAKKTVAFNREQVAKHRAALEQWERNLAWSEKALAEAVKAEAS